MKLQTPLLAALAALVNPAQPPMSDEAKKVLFGQDASTVTKP